MNDQLENNSEYVIPDISTKIKELTATKQVYLKFIIQLFSFLKDPIKQVYTNELIILLQNLINIHKNEILFELEDGLTSALVTYIYDIYDIIGGRLDLEKYQLRHQNLTAINQQVDYHMKTKDFKRLIELKMNLFLVA